MDPWQEKRSPADERREDLVESSDDEDSRTIANNLDETPEVFAMDPVNAPDPPDMGKLISALGEVAVELVAHSRRGRMVEIALTTLSHKMELMMERIDVLVELVAKKDGISLRKPEENPIKRTALQTVPLRTSRTPKPVSTPLKLTLPAKLKQGKP